jgi:hypothetical protein
MLVIGRGQVRQGLAPIHCQDWQMTGRILSDQEWRLQEEAERFRSHANQSLQNMSQPDLEPAVWHSNCQSHYRWMARANEAKAKLAELLAKREGK